jgi:hypothetical protein
MPLVKQKTIKANDAHVKRASNGMIPGIQGRTEKKVRLQKRHKKVWKPTS